MITMPIHILYWSQPNQLLSQQFKHVYVTNRDQKSHFLIKIASLYGAIGLEIDFVIVGAGSAGCA